MTTMFSTLRRWFTRPTPEFDPAWEAVLTEHYAHWSTFDDDERRRMQMLTARFIADNEWEAAKGMDITSEVQVLIAAQASMLLLGLEIDEYFDITSIIVHRSTVRLRGPRRGAAGTTSDGVQHLSGQATPKGPVVLSWAAVKRGAARPDAGENVVYHEFAHRLDMLDGLTDGTPPLGDDAATAKWADICSQAYARVQAGESVLRSYAATNIAEFFAVATEAFFNRPHLLAEHEPALYHELRTFYGQEPTRRVAADTH